MLDVGVKMTLLCWRCGVDLTIPMMSGEDVKRKTHRSMLDCLKCKELMWWVVNYREGTVMALDVKLVS